MIMMMIIMIMMTVIMMVVMMITMVVASVPPPPSGYPLVLNTNKCILPAGPGVVGCSGAGVLGSPTKERLK